MNPGDPAEAWVLNAAQLYVLPGGATLGIDAQPGSTVGLDGATVTGGTKRGVNLVDTQATINNSTVTSARDIGLSVVKVRGSAAPGSTALVTNSQIAGTGRGLNVSDGSSATLVDSQVTGTGALGTNPASNGLGVSLPGGEAMLRNSSATGSNRAAGLFSNSAESAAPRLVLDHSNLTSQAGSAIVVSNLGTLPMAAEIIIGNGSTLTAANQTLVEVGLPGERPGAVAQASITIDASTLTGNIQAATGAIADLTMVQGASLTGTLDNLRSLSMNASTVNGTLNEPMGSTATAKLAAGSVFTGNLNNLGSLSVDASQVSGDVVSTPGSATVVTLNNGSALTGSVNNVASLSLDQSQMTGEVISTPGSATVVTLHNTSSLTGSVNDIASLSLDQSRMDGDVTSTPGSGTVVTLNNASALIGSVNNAASLSLDQSQMAGDVNSTPGSGPVVTLNNASTLTGSVNDAASTHIGATSTFAMTNSSNVGALTLEGGTVDLRAGQGPFRTLTATSLSGGGTFVLGTDLAGHLSDQVNIEGQAEGNHGLLVQNTGVDPVAEDHAQQVVHTEGGGAQFALRNANGLVDVGTFSYRLEQRDTDWYLVQNQDGTQPPIISPSARTAIAVFSAAPTVWYGEMSTLRSRMGELRGGRSQGGAWARTYGNKYQVSATHQVDYQQAQQGVSFGVDTPLPAQDGQWLIGVMGGYSESELNMRLGSNGRVNSYYLGVYSTWLSDNGYYLDAVLKANRFANKADVRMNDGEKATGDYDNYGIGGSVEAGRHIQLEDGWFIEPYAQVAALWVQGERYGLDNGMQASSNTANSLLGKVGTHVGRTFPLAAGGFVQPYVKVAAVHEFARNNKVKINETTFHDDLSGGRGEVGAGVAVQMTDALQVHADFDYSNGKNIEQPWGANVGIRYSW
ncbi:MULTISPECIES: autotransporter outer membrane beta-barrel domain-containing protein [unclassified Pseudomonas]|uniref:autotransporter outer membrane beta-barrel domain-containing protein n=1 Tax=unclassified Pseudomonas TaxID=196821 RepID=UPI003804F0BB